MEDLEEKPKLSKPKEAYVKKTLRFLKNAMRNILKEYYSKANENMKEKDDLEFPTKEKFSKMYNKLTIYNKNKKSLIKLQTDELKDLWRTAKSEISDEIKRLGQDGRDYDKELAQDSMDLVPDFSGMESLNEIPQEEVYMEMPELSTVTIQKLHYLLSNVSNPDFVSWYLQSGVSFLMQFLKNDISLKNIPNNYFINQEIDTTQNFGISTIIDINYQSKKQIFDLLIKLDQEKTTEQEVFILQIDSIINKVIAQYHISKNSTDKDLNPIYDIPVIQELSSIVGNECAINIYILFYFDMIYQEQLIEIDHIIKSNLHLD